MKKIISMLVSMAIIFYLLGYEGIEALKEFKGNDGDVATVLVIEDLYGFGTKEHTYVYEFINDDWVLRAIDPIPKIDTLPLGRCHR